MDSQEIINGNKLIAEFLQTKSSLVDDMYFGEDGKLYTVRDLRYHFRWDWLMLAVKRISDIGYAGGILEDLKQSLIEADIDCAFYCIVEHIEWFNDNIKGK